MKRNGNQLATTCGATLTNRRLGLGTLDIDQSKDFRCKLIPSRTDSNHLNLSKLGAFFNESTSSTTPHIPSHYLVMASPAALGSNALRASRRHLPRIALQTRGLAAPASGSFQYETGDASGVKYASRDIPGATTTLAVVAKAGSRYEPLPGYSDALEKFAFKVMLTSPRLPTG